MGMGTCHFRCLFCLSPSLSPSPLLLPPPAAAAARPSWRRANQYLHHLPTPPSTSTISPSATAAIHLRHPAIHPCHLLHPLTRHTISASIHHAAATCPSLLAAAPLSSLSLPRCFSYSWRPLAADPPLFLYDLLLLLSSPCTPAAPSLYFCCFFFPEPQLLLLPSLTRLLQAAPSSPCAPATYSLCRCSCFFSEPLHYCSYSRP